jgi:hypothetical protein
VITITLAQRRARLGRRHHLARPAATVEQATGGVLAWHATAASSVYLSAWSRLGTFDRAELDDAVYDRRTLVRMLGMRRTVFVAPVATAPVIDGACTQALVPGERRKVIALLHEAGTRDADRWLTRVEAKTLAALEAAGEATAAQLAKTVPELTTTFHVNVGKKYEGDIRLGSRVLFLLAASGKVVRGRPIGTWLSTQYRWAPASTWVAGDLGGMDPATARAELLTKWLRAFGPGSLTDIKWWTAWTVAQTKAALEAVDAVEVTMEVDRDGSLGAGFTLPDDTDPVRPPAHWVALLPALDPTTMGWKDRDWYLSPHEDALYDRSGNIGPTVWADGHIVGGWGQRPDGRVETRLLEPVTLAIEKKIDAEAMRLDAWLEGVRVLPPFRTPLEHAIASGD